MPANNICDSATYLCPAEITSGTTRYADVDTCPNCSDFNLFGSTNLQATVWYEFNTNQTGGSVFLTMDILLPPTIPNLDGAIQLRIVKKNNSCSPLSFQTIGNTFSSTSVDTTFIFTDLDPNSNYGIIINESYLGISNPGVDFTILISGSAVESVLPSGILEFPDTICANQNTEFTLSMNDCSNPVSIQWLINESVISSGLSPIFVSAEINQGDIVSAIFNCNSDCPNPVTISTVPLSVNSFNIDAGNDTTINPGETIQLNAYTDSPNFYWDTQLFISSTNVLNPFVYPDETFTYPFVASNNGCILYDYVTVFVREGLEIPNTFSPNGDNLNDSWKIPNIEFYPQNKLTIYNRYGVLLESFSPYTPSAEWTGIWKGKDLPEGVYFYVLEVNDTEKNIYKGTISIIR